jgi:hypothetical protein
MAVKGINTTNNCESCADLWLITTYFNPYHYAVRRANYQCFADNLRSSNLNLVTVECAFNDDPFELPPDGSTIQIRGHDLMWQRERLLNIGIASLPNDVKKVAWVDAELLFTNPNWAQETSAMLDSFPVVQLFHQIILLPPGKRNGTDHDPVLQGFGYRQMVDPNNSKLTGISKHGETGFGWAFRREILENHGLYDAHIGGDADHLMAHAMCGDFDCPCVNEVFITSLIDRIPRLRRTGFARLFRKYVPPNVRQRIKGPTLYNTVNTPFYGHFLNWATGFYDDIQGRVGAVPGTVLHLWHGNLARREYMERREILKSQAFDPLRDLRMGENGCWEWNSDKPELHMWIREHFQRRREDDVEADIKTLQGASG